MSHTTGKSKNQSSGELDPGTPTTLPDSVSLHLTSCLHPTGRLSPRGTQPVATDPPPFQSICCRGKKASLTQWTYINLREDFNWSSPCHVPPQTNHYGGQKWDIITDSAIRASQSWTFAKSQKMGNRITEWLNKKSTGTSNSSAILTISSSTLEMGIAEMLNITQSPLSYVSSHPSTLWHILFTAGSPSSAWGMPSWDFFLQEAFSDF